MAKNGLDTNLQEHIIMTTNDLERLLENINKHNSEENFSKKEEKNIISGFTKILTLIIMVGAVIWSAAVLSFSKMDEDKADAIHKENRERIIQIEKNDIEQTTILKEIKKSVDKLVQ